MVTTMTPRCAGTAVILNAVAALLTTAAATAHEWYPPDCCAANESAPVERLAPLADGAIRMTSRVGTTVVPTAFPRRESHDDRMHICMVRFGYHDVMLPVCLFVPPAKAKPHS